MNRNLAFLLILISCFAPNLAAQAPSTSHPSPPAATSSSSDKTGTLETRVEQFLRNFYAWGPDYDVRIGSPKPSPVPDLLELPITISKGDQSNSASVYVTKDGKFIFRGDFTDMTVDPLAEDRANLHIGNSPTEGPADAKVTLVEFADFECPSCRELDQILRDELPKHPEVRLVYKNFPLTKIHPWAMTAAIAGQCVVHQSPDAFWKMHDLIFDAQDDINPDNVLDKLTDFAKQLGLNVETFQSCMADPATAREIDKDIAEGHALNIDSTPTIFVNGRRIAGASEAVLNQFIEFESGYR